MTANPRASSEDMARAIESARAGAPRGPQAEVITTSAELARALTREASTTITIEKAFSIAAVGAAVGLIAESIAQLPLHMYEVVPGDGHTGKRRVTDHPVARLLKDPYRGNSDAFQWTEAQNLTLLLHGNALAQKVRSGGRVVELNPIHPQDCEVERLPTGKLRYKVQLTNGQQLVLPEEDVLHVRDRSLNGYTGDSRIKRHAGVFRLGYEAEQFGIRFFNNSGMPSGLLIHPGDLGVEGAKRLKAMWDATHSKDNAFGTAVLDGGLNYQLLSPKNTDSEFATTRRAQVTEVARVYRVPPHMIADLDRATFSNIEHQSQEFVQYTLLPWLRRWECAFAKQLLSPAERERYYFKFNVDGFLRGDLKSRYEAYQIGLQNGFLNVNTVLEYEDRDPIPGGDVYRQAASQYGEPGQPNKQAPPQEPDDEN